jgi:uncharacterized protein involved in response to NO
LHAFVMLYQMLPSFFFGFLLTTFPKWTKQPEVARRRFVPIGVGLLAGQLATLAGALGSHTAIVVGVGLTWRLERRARRAGADAVARAGTTWHARACVAALGRGTGIVRSARTCSGRR